MSKETSQNGWTIGTLKEFLEARIGAMEEALTLARQELERRLNGLNELRQDVEKDRAQFVKNDVYLPAHEELRRQRNTDNEKAIILTGQVQENSKDIASMKSSLMWLTRLIVGALVLAVISYAFQRLTGH